MSHQNKSPIEKHSVSSCSVMLDVAGKVALFQHKTTKILVLEGHIIDKVPRTYHVPGQEQQPDTPVVEEYKPAYRKVGQFRRTCSGIQYARNGKSLHANPQLIRIGTVDYSTGMELLHSQNTKEGIENLMLALSGVSK